MSSQVFGNECIYRQDLMCTVEHVFCICACKREVCITLFYEGVLGPVDSRVGGGVVRHALRR